jgi:hypothetical protein
MVEATRGNPDGFGNSSGSRSQQLPPPPPNLVEVIASLFKGSSSSSSSGVDTMSTNLRLPATRISWALSTLYFTRRMGTQHPLFHKTKEPLDMDAWIHTINSKFSLLVVPCSDASTAHFAMQQLCGTARLW